MAESGKETIFPASISTDLERLAARRASAFRRDGRYSPSAWLDFVRQFNLFAGRASRPLRPIKGDKFLL